MASEHDLCAACGHHRERHHPSCHVFPCACQRFSDVAPAPPVTPGLLAAAWEYVAALDHQVNVFTREIDGDVDLDGEHLASIDASIRVGESLSSLRAELAAATAGPVVLTGEERENLRTTLRESIFQIGEYGAKRSINQQSREGIDAVLAKLNDLGYALVRRPS